MRVHSQGLYNGSCLMRLIRSFLEKSEKDNIFSHLLGNLSLEVNPSLLYLQCFLWKGSLYWITEEP